MKIAGKSWNILSLAACLGCLCLAARAGEEPVLQFTGDGSYIDLGTPEALHMAEDAPFTMEGWVKFNSFSSVDMLYSRRASRGSGEYTYMFGSGDGNKMRAYIGHDGTPNTIWRDVTLDPVLETDRWYHLAFSFDGEDLAYYLDGVAIGAQDFRYSDHAGYQVMIGGYHDDSDIDGCKSDVRVWNHARDQDQIRSCMNYRLRGSETGLLGYWPLIEGAGSEVYDGTVNATTGTVINAEWTEDGTLRVYDPVPEGVMPSVPFTLADMETGSTDFTNSNEVDIVDFPIPDGYDQFQITEDGDIDSLGAWMSTSAVPANIDFAQPSTDTNISLYAWFTNETESVALRRGEGSLFYTESLPVPDVRASATIERLSGEDVVIYPAHIDAGSTGGVADGRAMEIVASAAVCAEEPTCDQTPGDPFVTVTSEGDYSIVLWLQNEAGNTVISATTSTVSVIPYSGENVWTGEGASDQWNDVANWSAGLAPVANQSVRIESGTPLLTGETPLLSSFTITNATLVFANWTTTLRANNVTIRNQGVLTLPPAFEDGAMSNRVHIICENIHLEEGGKIDADARGYASDNGPGVGKGGSNRAGGGGHGGHGGMGGHYLSYGGEAYGALRTPEAPGSGGATEPNNGGIGGAGGGAVRIEASSEVVIDGTITVRGEDSPYRGGGGAGGSIFMECAAFGGGITGLLRADGGTQDHISGSGGGGRIAVNYATLFGTPRVRFSAAPGGTEVFNPLTQWFKTAEMGTLFLPDLALLSEDLTDGRFNGVRLHTDGVLEWSVDSLSVSDTSLRLADDGVRVLVTNDIEILSGGALGIGANDALLFASLTCGGNLIVSNGAALSIYSGPTNGVKDHGAVVNVENDLRIHDNAWIYPYSQDADGGSVLFRVRNLAIDATSGFNAEARGFRYGMGPGKGTAAGYRGGGGGYGGVGGRGVNSGSYGGTTYGSAQAPIDPGSGSGVYHGFGGRGGGAIRVEASYRLVNDGQLVADGGDAHMHSGGGSGGGVYLRAAVLEGSGAIRADGGNGSNNYSGGGGGGRIAIETDIDRFTGETPGTYLEYGGAANDSISVLGATVGYLPGTNGTFHLWRPMGTLFLVQ